MSTFSVILESEKLQTSQSVAICCQDYTVRARILKFVSFFLIAEFKKLFNKFSKSIQCGEIFSKRAFSFQYTCFFTRYLKFIYSEKATKFCEIFPLLLTTVDTVKSKGKISQNFVAFSEYMYFNRKVYGCNEKRSYYFLRSHVTLTQIYFLK